MPNSIVAEFAPQHWAMEATRLTAFIERVAGLPEMKALSDIAIDQRPMGLKVMNGTAVIAISGVLLKTVPAWLRFFGIEATGYDEITTQIEAAVSDKSVSAIHLQVDSPGGMVEGVTEVADAIYNARAIKPVTAAIEDIGASAAYWLASQAQSIEAGRNAKTGSIGVYSIHVDLSEAREKRGVQVIVVRSGEHKGMGVDKVTDNQIAMMQQIIDAEAENFIEAVARGRGSTTEKISELATGQLWIAGAARELGLIDTVNDSRTLEVDISAVESESAAGFIKDHSEEITLAINKVKGDHVMDAKQQLEKDQLAKEQAEAAKVATEAIETATVEKERLRMAALQLEFKDDPDFAIAQFAIGASLEEAKAAYCDVLRERLAKQKTEVRSQETEVEGAAPIATGGTDGTSGADFIAEAKELAKEEGISVTAAMQKINRRDPGAHARFLERCASEGKQMYAVA